MGDRASPAGELAGISHGVQIRAFKESASSTSETGHLQNKIMVPEAIQRDRESEIGRRRLRESETKELVDS